ncbi:MAG: DUF6263 family protein [Chitinophagaceae bacterium]
MKLFNRIGKVLPIAAVALLNLTANAQKTITLKFNPANNAKYAMSATTKSVATQMGMDINMDMTMDMNCTVTPQQGKDKLMTMQYTNIKLDMDIMGQKLNLNSNETNAQSEPFKKLTTKQFGCVIAPDGKISKVVGVDSLASVFGAGNPAAQYFDEDAIKSSIGQYFSLYPNKPIAVGETWSNIYSVTNRIKLNAKVTYTLQKVENNLAYIKIASTLTTDSAQKINFNGMDFDMALGGTQNGEMVVDTQTGIYTSSTLVQDLKGTITAMGQKIPMTVKSNIASSCQKQ